jgi:hypothetical protein
MNWTEIFKEVGIVVVIAGLITWLIKKLGQSIIEKNLRAYELELSNKSELYKLELNQSFEEFKAELNLLSEKANKLHNKRIEHIQEIYSLLFDFHSDMQNLISWKVSTGMTPQEIRDNEIKRVQDAGNSGNKFFIYYSKNKLYFAIETCNLIDEIISILRDSHSDFSFKYIFGSMSAELEFENVRKASQNIRDKVPALKTKLEDNFRSIIGVL